MKPKILMFLCSICILTLTACNNEVKEEDHFYTPYGVDYFIDGDWEHVHETEIDITGMPNEFTLEFRTFGVREILPIDNDISITILDPIDPHLPLAENILEPIEFSEFWHSFRFLQKFRFNTKGEKVIKLKFFYKYWFDISECTCTLVRKV